MKPFTSRYLLLAAFSLLLGACQSTPPVAPQVPDARAAAIAQLEQNLASSELATAEDQLAALQAQSPDDPALEPYQRQLAEAYLQRSQIVLQKGDVNAAATALSRARALMPKAPALTGGVNSAIAHARKAELDKAEAALKAAEAKPPAKVIDPAAESTTVALNLTDVQQLRHQLDAIATDVVNYQCAVSLQVPRTADYPWLATLGLSTMACSSTPTSTPKAVTLRNSTNMFIMEVTKEANNTYSNSSIITAQAHVGEMEGGKFFHRCTSFSAQPGLTGDAQGKSHCLARQSETSLWTSIVPFFLGAILSNFHR